MPNSAAVRREARAYEIDQQVRELRRTAVWTVVGSILAALLSGAGASWLSRNRELITHDQAVDIVQHYSPVTDHDRDGLNAAVKSTADDVRDIRSKLETIDKTQARFETLLENLHDDFKSYTDREARGHARANDDRQTR